MLQKNSYWHEKRLTNSLISFLQRSFVFLHLSYHYTKCIKDSCRNIQTRVPDNVDQVCKLKLAHRKLGQYFKKKLKRQIIPMQRFLYFCLQVKLAILTCVLESFFKNYEPINLPYSSCHTDTTLNLAL